MLITVVLASLLASSPVPDVGRVTRVVPRVEVQHGGKKTKLYQDDAVAENDRIRTEPGGRARIQLGDGSILNVGSASELTIKSVGATGGPTSLDLAYGKIRAEVTKRMTGGTAFEIRTSTAVCGVLGTTLFIDQSKNSSHVINMSPLDSGSQVKVSSSNKKIKGEVTLNPGQGVIVSKGHAPGLVHMMPQADRDNFRELTEPQ